MLIVQTPLNAISWAIGALTVAVFGFKNWRRYQQTSSYLNKYFGLFGLITTFSLGFTSFPEFFTTDVQTLFFYNFLSDVFLYIAFMVQVRLLWFMALKEIMRYSYIVAFGLAVSLLGLLSALQGGRVYLANGFVNYEYPFMGALAQAILLMTVIVPIGIFFVQQGLKETTKFKGTNRAEIKSIIIGLAYILVGTTTAYNAIDNRGVETVQSSVANGIIFFLTLIVLLLPPLKREQKRS